MDWIGYLSFYPYLSSDQQTLPVSWLHVRYIYIPHFYQITLHHPKCVPSVLPDDEIKANKMMCCANFKENREDLSVLISSESGKPLIESRGEIAYAASYISLYVCLPWHVVKRAHFDLLIQCLLGCYLSRSVRLCSVQHGQLTHSHRLLLCQVC